MITQSRGIDGSIEEVVQTFADDFSGIISMLVYNYAYQTLQITYRLDDNVYLHLDVPRAAYEELRDAVDLPIKAEKAAVDRFTARYPGEAI